MYHATIRASKYTSVSSNLSITVETYSKKLKSGSALTQISKRLSLSLSPVMLGLLAACGPGKFSDDVYFGTLGADVPDQDVYVVDGPVRDAVVYVDENNDGKIDAGDTLIGQTDARGQIILPGVHVGKRILADLNGALDTFTGKKLTGVFARTTKAGESETVVSAFSTLVEAVKVSEAGSASPRSEAEIVDQLKTKLFGDLASTISYEDLNNLDTHLAPLNGDTSLSAADSDKKALLSKVNAQLTQFIQNKGDALSAAADILADTFTPTSLPDVTADQALSQETLSGRPIAVPEQPAALLEDQVYNIPVSLWGYLDSYSNDGSGAPGTALVSIKITGLSDNDGNTPILRSADGSKIYAVGDVITANELTALQIVSESETATSLQIDYTVSDGSKESRPARINIDVTPVNDLPIFTSVTDVTVQENIAANSLIHTVVATDADSTTVTYSLLGADAQLFTIDANSGALSFKSSPDFEQPSAAAGTNVYSVIVAANDGDGGTSTQQLNINVNDVNEAPTFASATEVLDTRENQIEQLSISVATDQDAGDSITYSISATDQLIFNIDAQTGVLSFREIPDHERQPQYSVVVTATDSQGLTATKTMTINVTNVNEAPRFSAPTESVSAIENQTGGIAISKATDVDAGDTTTYTISGGADSSLFNIDANTGALSFKTAPNFESPGSAAGTNAYNVQVRATDASGLSDTKSVTVNVTNANEAPVFASATETITTVENQTNSLAIAAATDIDANNPLTYSISDADSLIFNINARTGALSFKNAPDYEAQSSYTVVVTATDGGGLSATKTVTVNVTNANEAPTFSSSTQTVLIEENRIGPIAITAATDVDAGDARRYTISGGADATLFNIDANTGALSFKAGPDFEAPGSAAGTNAYDVQVTATDNGGLTATKTVTVRVTDVNDAPVFSPGTETVSIAENHTGPIAISRATDVDARDTLSYSIFDGVDASKFTINSSTGALSFKTAPNYESPGSANRTNSYTLRVMVSDSSGVGVLKAVTINVTNVNEAPTFSAGIETFSIAENQAGPIAITAATDVDAGETLRYSIDGGADSLAFDINTSTGALSFKNAPDYESPGSAAGTNAYSINVSVIDQSGARTTKAITINVTNVNEAPRFESDKQIIEINEGTRAVTITPAVDHDANDNITYTLSGTDASLFDIDSVSGDLLFKTAPDHAAPTDADDNNQYLVKITATDSSGLFVTSEIIINVLDVI